MRNSLVKIIWIQLLEQPRVEFYSWSKVKVVKLLILVIITRLWSLTNLCASVCKMHSTKISNAVWQNTENQHCNQIQNCVQSLWVTGLFLLSAWSHLPQQVYSLETFNRNWTEEAQDSPARSPGWAGDKSEKRVSAKGHLLNRGILGRLSIRDSPSDGTWAYSSPNR